MSKLGLNWHQLAAEHNQRENIHFRVPGFTDFELSNVRSLFFSLGTLHLRGGRRDMEHA